MTNFHLKVIAFFKFVSVVLDGSAWLASGYLDGDGNFRTIILTRKHKRGTACRRKFECFAVRGTKVRVSQW